MNDSLPTRDIVLLGAGHTNCHIIRMWKMRAIPKVRLTCVSDHPVATYSGMLAGTLAGQYETSRMEIDLIRLCAASRVRFIQATASGLDVEKRRLLFADRPPMPYDVLSIGIGSRPSLPASEAGGLSIKPMQTFLDRLTTRLQQFVRGESHRPLRMAIVGSGAGGTEVALCLPPFIQRVLPDTVSVELVVIEGHDRILPGMPQRTQELASREFRRRNVTLKLNARVERMRDDGGLVLDSSDEVAADIVIWATTARAPRLLAEFGLPLDDLGFLLMRDTLQSVGSDAVFAVGDCGTLDGVPLAKAGVYAVRQGPVLWQNMRRYLEGRELRHWQPQKSFLTLINTGDDRAIFTLRGMSHHARWCWWLKDWIDSRFMDKYQRYEPPVAMNDSADDSQNEDDAMQCGGCGCKTSASLLQRSLPAIHNPACDHVLLGLNSLDDVALLKHRNGRAIMATTDFFSAFIDDPYLLGRIAALNALSDIYAKGGDPRAALSMAIIPQGSEAQQANLLDDLLAGAAREFNSAGVPIVGGHTIVGPSLTFGFTVLGDSDAENVMQKSTPTPGDCLVMTKALGTGVLLAAHMRAACRWDWWQPLLDSMLVSNRSAAQAARRAGARASTDVTGFGLAGHLLEMMSPAGVSATISLDALKLLPGAAELLAQGLQSTLSPKNRESFPEINVPSSSCDRPEVAALFDPQTSGGLLVALPEENVASLLSDCGEAAAVIGRITESKDSESTIHVEP